jgi:methionine synthase II (cobalamin-independent)
MSSGFNFLTTGVGSLPFSDPKEACELIFQYMPEAPHWPQLPQTSRYEGMIEQFAEGMPGWVEDGGKTYLRSLEPIEDWERFYHHYEESLVEAFTISRERAVGLYVFLEELPKRPQPRFIKGQVTGPITLGLSLKDEHGIAAFFDQNLRDMLVKIVVMKARWQEAMFERVLPASQTIIFIDEPILSSYGSAFMSVSGEEVVKTLKEVIAQLRGIKGVHICGNTDWSMIMEIGLDIIDFDAYNYLDSFLLYSRLLRTFLEGGGVVGWGIVPTEEEALKRVGSAALAERIKGGVDRLIRDGLSREVLAERSIITPSCGAGSLSEVAARQVYQLTREVSDLLGNTLIP